jgi:hypothetical protein
MGMDSQLTSEPSEVRKFSKGKFEILQVGPMTVGRASYEPGWRWATDVGGAEGALCQVEHVMEPGQFFHVPPGHDSWVVGDEPCVSLHLLGSEDYAA